MKKGGCLKKIIITVVILLVVLFIIGMLADGDGTVTENTTNVGNAQGDSVKQSAVSEKKEDGTSQSSDYSPVDFYDILQENEIASYTLNSKAKSFLKEYEDLFPCKGMIEEDLIDYGIEAKHILKNESKYGDMLMSLPLLGVVEIQEEVIPGGKYITSINTIDEYGQQYYVFYKGALDDIFEGDMINVIGLPLGNSSYDNVEGGKSLVIVLAGSTVKKIEE
ncbi:hypothetical protein HNQ56_003807 [Anaerotaenia torta]|uniref:hypothetical protein n=1 Tax=Anaerotaenia torta TaxID=433293 RepID=UPI003D23965D